MYILFPDSVTSVPADGLQLLIKLRYLSEKTEFL